MSSFWCFVSLFCSRRFVTEIIFQLWADKLYNYFLIFFFDSQASLCALYVRWYLTLSGEYGMSYTMLRAYVSKVWHFEGWPYLIRLTGGSSSWSLGNETCASLSKAQSRLFNFCRFCSHWHNYCVYNLLKKFVNVY